MAQPGAGGPVVAVAPTVVLVTYVQVVPTVSAVAVQGLSFCAMTCSPTKQATKQRASCLIEVRTITLHCIPILRVDAVPKSSCPSMWVNVL